jgi:hypothetical protein
MPSVVDLLLAYGLCFGLMNKVDLLRKVAFFDRMLSCSYCTGFHAGWLAWALTRAVHGLPTTPQEALTPILWAFASSAVCYLLDAASQAVERVAAPLEK